MSNNLPRKYRMSLFSKIRNIFSKIINKKQKNNKEQSINQTARDSNFKNELREKYIAEENKQKIIDTIKKQPKLLEQMSEERLKLLNQWYSEIIAQNNNKIEQLKRRINHGKGNNLKEIKQKLKNIYNSTYIIRFIYRENYYIQAFENDSLKIIYFKYVGNEIKKVNNQHLLEVFKSKYEFKPSSIVYSETNLHSSKRLQEKLKLLSCFKDNLRIFNILDSVKSDEEKLEILDQFKDEYDRAIIVGSMKSDEEKLRLLDQFEDEECRAIIVSQFKCSDDRKIEMLEQVDDESIKLLIVLSLINDEKKIKLLNQFQDAIDREVILASLMTPIDDEIVKKRGIKDENILQVLGQKNNNLKIILFH